jgi:AraC family transcriptional activator of pyochelin receptor
MLSEQNILITSNPRPYMTADLMHKNIRLTSHLGGRLIVYSARGHLAEDLIVRDPIENGLKLVISNVNMRLRASENELRVNSPTAFAVLSEGRHEREHVFYAGRKRWDVALILDRELVIEELGKDPDELLHRQKQQTLILRSTPADDAMQAMAMQLLSAPQGRMGNMVRLGTGLNLAAMVLGQLARQSTSAPSGLNRSDLQRVAEACEVMSDNLAAAPDMASLAKHTGTNPGKHSRDFKAVTGLTPNAWLQEERLSHAWHLLSTRSKSVAEVAHDVGYSPAYFATLFRRRFNVSPSDLAR